MNINGLRTVRWRFIYAAFASALLCGTLLFMVYRLLLLAITYPSLFHPGFLALWRWIINHVGARPVLAGLGFLLYAAFFYYRSGAIVSDLMNAGNRQAAACASSLDKRDESQGNCPDCLNGSLGYLALSLEALEKDRDDSRKELYREMNAAYDSLVRVRELLQNMAKEHER